MFEGQRVAAVIVAAGESRRMGFDKLFHKLDGIEVLRRSLRAFDRHPDIDALVVVAGQNRDKVRELLKAHPTAKPCEIVAGGATRTASVAAGVAACGDAALVAIHDGARPFVSKAVIHRTVAAAAETGAAAPALPVADTIKQVEGDEVLATVSRDTLRAVQTPQVFRLEAYRQALCALPLEEYAAITDDCMVMERAGYTVQLVPGEAANRKMTTPDDLPGEENPMRIGHGYDVHRFAENRRLILGGVNIPYEMGLLGHSDADVLLHAVSDALLGGAALGDIGRLFPDSDAAYKDADSLKLLRETAVVVREAGWQAANVDATVLCQAPKLAPYVPEMRKNIAEAIGIEEGAVSVKATTEEGLGFTGQKQGIAAHCVVSLRPAVE